MFYQIKETVIVGKCKYKSKEVCCEYPDPSYKIGGTIIDDVYTAPTFDNTADDQNKYWNWAADSNFTNEALFSGESFEKCVRLNRRDKMTSTNWEDIKTAYDLAN